jgi:hypothetical protein
MGHSFLYARQNTGLLWHTAVRPLSRKETASEYDKMNKGQLRSVRTVINILHFLKPINCIYWYMYHMKTGVFQSD